MGSSSIITGLCLLFKVCLDFPYLVLHMICMSIFSRGFFCQTENVLCPSCQKVWRHASFHHWARLLHDKMIHHFHGANSKFAKLDMKSHSIRPYLIWLLACSFTVRFRDMPHVSFIAATTSWIPGSLTVTWMLSCLYWAIYSDTCPVHLKSMNGFDIFHPSRRFLEEYSFGWPLFAHFAGDSIMPFTVNTVPDGTTGRGLSRLRRHRRSWRPPSMTCQCYWVILLRLHCSRHMVSYVISLKSHNFNANYNPNFQPSISKLLASTKEFKSKETVSKRFTDVCPLRPRVLWMVTHLCGW